MMRTEGDSVKYLSVNGNIKNSNTTQVSISLSEQSPIALIVISPLRSDYVNGFFDLHGQMIKTSF